MAKTLSMATGRIWLDNVNPTADEEYIEQGNFWLNTDTKALFFCTDDTPEALVWEQITFAAGT